jgi:diguanylate cyclase (GGDEF)-like protein/PAS domain S-box-containing protein
MKRLGKLNSDFKNDFCVLDFFKTLSRELLDTINIAAAVYEAIDDGKDFIFKDFSKTAEKIDKIKKKDLIGKSVKEIFPGVVEFGLFDVFKRVYKTGRPEHHPVCTYKDNRISGWRENFVIKFPSGEIGALYKDLTKEKQIEEEVKTNEEKYRSLFERSLDGIYETTIDGKYIDVNPSLVKMLGYDNKKELMSIDIPTQLYVSKNDRPGYQNRNKFFETKLKKKDGSIIHVEIGSRVVYKDDKPSFYEGIVRDVTEKKRAEGQLKFLSYHDKLTGVYNRAYFEEELKRLDSKRQLPLSIIMGDINGLKLVNDAFGHKKGDLLICKCASILKKCFRKDDIIARWGGDEFIILLPKTTDKVSADIIKRVEEECLKSRTQKIPNSISMGSSTKTNLAKTINEVILEAEEWMYQRKLIESKSLSSSIITSLKKILLEKSIETEEHTERTIALALQLGRTLNLTDNELSELSLLATLHDIGKVAIPEEIILKKSKLSKAEWKIIKKHPKVGYSIAKATPHLASIAGAILSHHEWWDGSGYPQGLKGDEIPLPSRILAVVDAYDVMVFGRHYKNKMDIGEIIEEFKKYSGKQFDPNIVKIFLYTLRNKK